MFEDFFTTYSSFEPPPIKRRTKNPLYLQEIDPYLYKNNMVTTIDSPDINWNIDMEDEQDLFSFKADKPIFQPEKPIIEQTSSIAQNAVDLARSFIGEDYVYGGKSPKSGFDCSGLISYVYKQSGVDIPSSTFGLFKTGQEVSLGNVQIGDIICTPGSGRSGRHVKMISKIDQDGQIYTIEAKGKKYGIVESPLTRTDNIITIRRITKASNSTFTPQTSYNGVFSNKKDFIKTLNNTFKKVLKENNLDPNYSYILTAQAAMESGWGKHLAGRYNFGGIKISNKEAEAHPQKANRALTTDWSKDKGYFKRYQNFRNFSSIEDYCNYKITLLSNSRYNAFNSVSAKNPYNFIYHILSKGYGSDYGGPESRKYAASVMKNYNDILNTLET